MKVVPLVLTANLKPRGTPRAEATADRLLSVPLPFHHRNCLYALHHLATF